MITLESTLPGHHSIHGVRELPHAIRSLMAHLSPKIPRGRERALDQATHSKLRLPRELDKPFEVSRNECRDAIR